MLGVGVGDVEEIHYQMENYTTNFALLLFKNISMGRERGRGREKGKEKEKCGMV